MANSSQWSSISGQIAPESARVRPSGLGPCGKSGAGAAAINVGGCSRRGGQTSCRWLVRWRNPTSFGSGNKMAINPVVRFIIRPPPGRRRQESSCRDIARSLGTQSAANALVHSDGRIAGGHAGDHRLSNLFWGLALSVRTAFINDVKRSVSVNPGNKQLTVMPSPANSTARVRAQLAMALRMVLKPKAPDGRDHTLERPAQCGHTLGPAFQGELAASTHADRTRRERPHPSHRDQHRPTAPRRAAHVVNQDVVTRITHHAAQRLAVVEVDGSGSMTRSGQILHGRQLPRLGRGRAPPHRSRRAARAMACPKPLDAPPPLQLFVPAGHRDI